MTAPAQQALSDVKPPNLPDGNPAWPRATGWSCVVVVALVLLPILWALRAEPVRVFDEGVLLVYPEQILRGAVPNRDFFNLYPPGNFWVIAGAYKLLGVSV